MNRKQLFETTVGTRKHRALATVCGLAVLLHGVAMAVPPPNGAAGVLSPYGGFGIDGNLMGDDPVPGVGDWIAGTNGGGVLNAAGAPLDPAMTFHFIDPYSGSGTDLIFAGGLKWTDNPNTWGWTTGKPSSKTEINNVLMHIATDDDGHMWTVVSADRASTSGESYIDFEFLQNPLYRTNGGAFISGGPHGGRTTNDLLLSLAFVDGGSVADFYAWRWQANGSGGYGYVDVTASLPVGRVFVALNTIAMNVPYGAFGRSTYLPNAFAEAAVDMTALLGNFDPCLSFGVRTIMVKTKASSSSSASIEDFIDPIQVTLQIGPAALAGPDQTRCSEGELTAFPLNGKTAAGIYPVTSTTWSVISGDATIETPNSLTTVARVASGTATLRLTASQANGCVATDDIVLRVVPLPQPNITGPAAMCPGSSAQFEGPAGMSEYAWSVTGNGVISGASNARTVTVQAGPGCGEDFALALAVSANGCSSTCMTNIVVTDTTAPTLAVPADLVLECPAETGTNATGVATAQDDCAVATVSYSDAVQTICGGAKVITRTWTATDVCGNTSSAAQKISVQDNRKPTLIAPANITLECPANTDPAQTGMSTATDECGQVVVTWSDQTTPGCGGEKVIARTWVATDECGNASTAVQTITVKDTRKPTLTAPANITLECPANTDPAQTGMGTATDECSQVVVTWSDQTTPGCGGEKVIARTWVATDECGNASTAVQTITVKDTRKPTLTAPANITLECPANTDPAQTGMGTATDECSQVVVTWSDQTTPGCGGEKVIARTWVATDECGNASTAEQTITVKDTRKPTLTAPANITLECPANTAPAQTGMGTGTDECSQVVVTWSDQTTPGCGGEKVIVRTWVATDECGNASTAVQTITVKDTRKPTLVAPANITLECPANTAPAQTGMGTGTDECSQVVVTWSDQTTPGCGGEKVIVRTWVATDECGNASTAVQTITVKDTRKPTLIAPANITLECPANTDPTQTGMGTATDECSQVVVTWSDQTTPGCGGEKVIARTWVATDQCGNASTAVQTITVRDTLPPTLILPGNLVLECPGDTRTNVTGIPTVQDGCGSVSVGYSDVVSTNCGVTRTVLRLWTATDQCGNSTNGLQTIVVQDSRKPSITCPIVKVQCVGDIPAPYASLTAFRAAGGTAADTCDSALTFSLVSDSGLVGSCPGTVTRVYRVTDACGNFAEGTQTITVDDTIAPVLTCPPGLTVECTNSFDLANIGQPTATDNCDPGVEITYSDVTVPSQYIIKWYSADPDGGHAPYLPTYLKLAPASLSCPEEARLTGRAADPLRNAVAYGPTSSTLDALTSLGAEPMTFGQIVPFMAVIEVSGGTTRPENGTIEFTSSWSTHTTSNEEFGYDKNYMVYCAFVDIADPGYLDPHNNAKVDSFSSTLVGGGTVDEKIQGTFRVSGLESGDRVVVEIWVVLMSARPRNSGGTIASDLVSAQKALSPPQPISTGAQTVSIGNLSKLGTLPAPQEQPPLGPVPQQPPPLPGETLAVIDRTWRATDDCGNQATCVQRITVRDAAPPVLVLPGDVVLECPADTGTNNTGVATASDGCGTAVVTYTDTVTTDGNGNEIIARTWTTTDNSGNSASGVQTITVRDTTAPSLTPRVSVTLTAEDYSSGEGAALIESHFAQVFTNGLTVGIISSGPEVSASQLAILNPQMSELTALMLNIGFNREGVLGSGPNNFGDLVFRRAGDVLDGLTVTQIAEAADRGLSGLGFPAGYDSASMLELLSELNGAFKDGQTSAWAAAHLGMPLIVVQCAGDLPTAAPEQVIASDECSGALQVYALPDAITAQNSVNDYRIARTWVALDACGNSNACTIEILVQDTTAPTLICGADLTVASGDSWSFEPPMVADNCDQAVANVVSTTTNQALLGASTITRTWEAVDLAGNRSTGSQIVTVMPPANPPVITQHPVSTTAGMGEQAVLSVVVTGSEPLVFQWLFNGAAIAGASEPSLVLNDLQFSNAGTYSVTVSNLAGAVTSQAAIVNVTPDIAIVTIDGKRYLVWPEGFVLQSAGTPQGPYVDVPGATSPYLLDTSAAPQQYYRLRSASPEETTTVNTDGLNEITITGSPGVTYILQGSTDFVTWVNLVTNTAPFTWVDVESAAMPIRFYRVIPFLMPGAIAAVAPQITAQPVGGTVTPGAMVKMAVTATGTGPLLYQWLFEGKSIEGATGSALTISDAQFANAGAYTVLVGNGAGTVTSAAALVNVLPRAIVLLTPGGLSVTWPDGYMLQSATEVTGPFADLSSASSPFVCDTTAAPQMFFRLRAPEATVAIEPSASGINTVSVTGGAPGCNYVLQVSSGMSSWETLHTGIVPFTFVDDGAIGATKRFYRAVPVLQ